MPTRHITITHPTHNSTDMSSCYILMASWCHSLSVSIKNCHTASEYYGSIRLYSGEYGLIPLPSLQRRQDKTIELIGKIKQTLISTISRGNHIWIKFWPQLVLRMLIKFSHIESHTDKKVVGLHVAKVAIPCFFFIYLTKRIRYKVLTVAVRVFGQSNMILLRVQYVHSWLYNL